MFQLGETAVSPKHHHPEQAKCPAGLLKAANKDSKKNHCSPFELLNSTKNSNCLWWSYTNTEDMWSSVKKFLFVHIKIHRKAVKSDPVLPLLTGRTGWSRFCHYYINICFCICWSQTKTVTQYNPNSYRVRQTPNQTHAWWKQAGKRDEDAK